MVGAAGFFSAIPSLYFFIYGSAREPYNSWKECGISKLKYSEFKDLIEEYDDV